MFTLIIILVFILSAFVFWICKIVIFYRLGETKKATINTSVFLIVILAICSVIPFARALEFRNRTQMLTGKKFWCWNDYRYEEIGPRGEGFSFEIYELNNEMQLYFSKPDTDFFSSYPTSRLGLTKWRETPVVETNIVDLVTPLYGNWSQELKAEIQEQQKLVREIASQEGSYYSIRNTHGTDLYLISPKKKVIIFINHDM